MDSKVLEEKSADLALLNSSETLEVQVDPLDYLSTNQEINPLDYLSTNQEDDHYMDISPESNLAIVKEEPEDNVNDSLIENINSEVYPSCSSKDENSIEDELVDEEEAAKRYEENAVLAYKMLLQHTLGTNKEKDEDSVKLMRCTSCDYSTYKITYLKKHSLIHSAQTVYECSSCSYKTIRKPCLKRHELSHSEDRQFACSECNFSTKVKRNLARHMQNHSSEKKLICPLCSYATNNKAHYHRHMQAHLDKHIKCPHCDYRTHRKDHLQRHLLKHSNPQQLKCTECTYMTVFKREMNMHILRHRVTKNFACEECPYQTNIKYHFQRHLWIHSNKRFSCNSCGYKSNRPDCLKKHLLAKHFDVYQTEEDAEEYLREAAANELLNGKPNSICNVDNPQSDPLMDLLSETNTQNAVATNKIPLAGCHFLSVLNEPSNEDKSDLDKEEGNSEPGDEVSMVDVEDSQNSDTNNEIYMNDKSNPNSDTINSDENGDSCKETDDNNDFLTKKLPIEDDPLKTVSSPDDEEILYMNYLGNILPRFPVNGRT